MWGDDGLEETRERTEERERRRRSAERKMHESTELRTQQWRDAVTRPMREVPMERATGVSGVRGHDRTIVNLLLDNARMPRDQTQSDGVMKFSVLSASGGAGDNQVYTPKELAAVHRIRVHEFSWPTIPGTTYPKTNRSEVSLFIKELHGLAAEAFTDEPTHFRGRLSVVESVQLLYYNSKLAGISDTILHSLQAQAQWYTDTIYAEPPVNLESISVEVRRRGVPVSLRPYRVTLKTSSLTPADQTVQLRRSDDAAHELAADMEVYFEVDLVDNDGTVLMAADTSATITLVDTIDFTIEATTAPTTATAASSNSFNALIPERRLQIGLEVELTRVATRA